MNLIDDAILKFQKGSPVLLEDVCALISPKVGDVVDIGYTNFCKYVQILTMDKPILKEESEISTLLDNLSTFQYFLIMCQTEVDIGNMAKQGFKFFTGEDVIFSLEPPGIVFGEVGEKRIMDEALFHDFRHFLKRMCFIEVEEKEIIIYEDDTDAVKALKKRMMRNREQLARAKAKKHEQENGGNDLEFSDLIASVPFGECNLNMQNIWDITYYSLRDQLKRMGWHEAFDINQRAALAGAKIKKSDLQHWIKSIANDKN